MVKHRKHISKCSAASKMIGNNILITTACPIVYDKGAKCSIKSRPKAAPVKQPVHHKKVVRRVVVPAECVGVHKYEKRNCIKAACAKLSPDKKEGCLKRARIKAR